MIAADNRIVSVTAAVVARTIELAQVPGPPLQEGDRAAVVAGWWRDDGLAPHIDDVGNVWARVRDGEGAAVVVAAHLDTVFAPTVEHGAVRDGDRLVGPGVGDDTIALASLSQLDVLLPATDAPVWIVGTVGEEGLGDLAGAKAACAHPPTPIKAFIALEGNYLGRITTVAVGSVRYRIVLTTPGGHAWERAADPSAVHAAGRLVAALADLAAADESPKRAVNVGRIDGGEAINARAKRCTIEVDLRSDDPVALDALDRSAREAGARIAAAERAEIEFVPIGSRPAGTIDEQHPLVIAAAGALRAIGREPQLIASSTDANAALAAGIPAVTIGITVGAGEHTEQEWIALEPIGDGLVALTRTVIDVAKEIW